jgi:two-component system KDP operon response regulator KdpE
MTSQILDGALTVDLVQRKVLIDGYDVQCTPNEYKLLRVLVNHAGKVITHNYLLRESWGAELGILSITFFLNFSVTRLT